MTCSVEHCERLASTRGMCTAHYHRWVRHGDRFDRSPVGYRSPDWGSPLPPNPWRGQRACPECGLAEWTLPVCPQAKPGYYEALAGVWRCLDCHSSWVPKLCTAL